MASDISTLLLLSVSDVEQVVAKMQELQCSISALHRPGDPAKNASNRIVNLLRKAEAEEEPSPATWSQWSTAAKQVHEVVSEISMASQFAKQIAKKVFGGGSIQDNLQKSFDDDSFQTAHRLLLPSLMASDGYGNDADAKSPETVQKTEMMTTAFVDLSNDKTLLPSATLLSMKTATANKQNVAKPPHLFKVVVGAKSGSVAGSFQSFEAHKIAPSPVLPPERRSGILVSKSLTPKHIPALASSCRRSYPSHGAAVRRSMEKKVKLRRSSELGSIDGRTVRLCKLSTTEGTAVVKKRATKEEPGRAAADMYSSKTGDNEVIISHSVNPVSLLPPPLVLPLSSAVKKVEESSSRSKKKKKWLPQRFSSKAKPETAKTAAITRHKTRTPSKPLPALITKLPPRKLMNSSTTTTAIPSAQALLDPADMKLSSSKTVPPPLLPLPPARQAAERKRIAAEAVIKSSSSVVTAGNVQVGTKAVVAVSPCKSVTDSRISLKNDSKLLEEADSGILLTRSREQQEKKVEVKDSAASLKSTCSSMDLRRRDVEEGLELPPLGAVVVPSLLRMGSGVGKENKHNSSNLVRSSSVGNQQQKSSSSRSNKPPLTVENSRSSSGKSLLTRAKSWMSLQSTKDHHDNGRGVGGSRRGEVVYGCLSSSSSAAAPKALLAR
ncbi:hypothetical protein CY35_04G126100 [Sphagnum magellanicum]|nr:hypothetical protein CY35_04G126100 [Sphagnum magellanicum]